MLKTYKITLSIQKLLDMIETTKDDVGLQTVIVEKILNHLPTAYTEMCIRTWYFERCHRGSYYILKYPADIKIYCTSLEEVKGYLYSTYPEISSRRIQQFINGERKDLYGIILQKEEGRH
jgi:hypothetical protein